MSIDELEDDDSWWCETGLLGFVQKVGDVYYLINDGKEGWMKITHIPDNVIVHKRKRNRVQDLGQQTCNFISATRYDD